MNATVQFIDAIRAAGLTPPDRVIADGKLRRFPTNGNRADDSGWYVLHLDGIPAGSFGCFRAGVTQTWRADIDRPLSPVEIAELRQKVKSDKRQREEAEKARRAKASAKARRIVQAATLDPASHPYAMAKRVDLGPLARRGAWPQREWQDALLLPMYDAAGGVQSVEAINIDGSKDFLIGGRKRGCFYPFGKIRGATQVVICEGVANAAVCVAATGSAAVAAMDAGNLPLVAAVVRAMAPNADIVIGADNDVRDDGTPNTGIEAAWKAAALVGGRVAVPELDGRKCDFWDLWSERGPEAVNRAIANAAASGIGEDQPANKSAPEGDPGRPNDAYATATPVPTREKFADRRKRSASPGDATMRKSVTLKVLQESISATADFYKLTKDVVRQVAGSNLAETERDLLYRKIADKAHVSVAAVRKDANAFRKIAARRDENHLAAARQVITKLGPRNVIGSGGFVWLWNGSVWRRAEDREIKQHVHAVAEGRDLTQSVVNSIFDLLKTEVHRPGHHFDTRTDDINVVNGSLRYHAGAWHLTAHRREDYLTTCIPVAYDPSATAPRFAKFLHEVFAGDPDANDKARVIEEAIGYTLTPSCHMEKFFMLIGSGANGKSVLLNVLANLVGRDQVAAVQPAQFDNRFQRGHLLGKLANIVTEIPEGSEIADAALKALVSGEIQTAERKFHDPFDFVPVGTHWFGTNHLPHTRDFSDALFRRAVVISFNRRFDGAERDVHLAEKLVVELPGILNLALDGLARLFDRNSFTEPASCIEITRQWRLEADQAAQFAEEACVIPSPGSHASSAEVYGAYQTWADQAGIQRRLGRNTLSNRLQRLGCVLGKGSGGRRLIHGLTLWPGGRPEYGDHRG